MEFPWREQSQGPISTSEADSNRKKMGVGKPVKLTTETIPQKSYRKVKGNQCFCLPRRKFSNINYKKHFKKESKADVIQDAISPQPADVKLKIKHSVQVAWWSMFVCGRTFRYTTIWFRVIVLLFLNLLPRWITNAWSLAFSDLGETWRRIQATWNSTETALYILASMWGSYFSESFDLLQILKPKSLC